MQCVGVCPLWYKSLKSFLICYGTSFAFCNSYIWCCIDMICICRSAGAVCKTTMQVSPKRTRLSECRPIFVQCQWFAMQEAHLTYIFIRWFAPKRHDKNRMESASRRSHGSSRKINNQWGHQIASLSKFDIAFALIVSLNIKAKLFIH